MADPNETRYYIECPNCGNQSGSYSPEMTSGGRMCSYGANFRIDVENQEASELLNDPDADRDA